MSVVSYRIIFTQLFTALFLVSGAQAAIRDIVRISPETGSAQPAYVVANPDSGLTYVAIPIAPSGVNASLLTPIKITESGRALLMNKPWQGESQASIGVPLAYRWLNGDFEPLHHSPAWQSAGTVLLFDDGFGDYYWYYTGQTVKVSDMNEAGDVIGYFGTDWDNSVVNSPTGWMNFVQPAVWHAGQSDAQAINAIAASRFQVGDILAYRDPPQNIPQRIADSGKIYGDYIDTGMHGLSVVLPDAHKGMLTWDSATSAAQYQEDRFIVAVSPDGTKSLTADVLIPGLTNRTYSVNGVATMLAAPLNLDGTGRINNHGRFIVAGKWAESSVPLQSIPGLNASIVAPGKALAINDANHLLGMRSNGNYGIWEWHAFPMVVTTPITGFYRERATTFSSPAGWSVFHIAPSLTNTGLLLGTIRKTSQPSLTSPAVLVPAGLYLDGNNDGKIEPSKQVDQATIAAPYRSAINDDDDIDLAATTETTGMDWQNDRVDGLDDLADFFPVFLDIKQLLTVLPPGNAPGATVKYKLKQADEKLNFVYTSLTRTNAFGYRVPVSAAGYGPNAAQSVDNATTQLITATGVELLASFLARIKDQDQGVILIEMRGMTAAPLKLIVEKNDVQIAEVSVNIATGEVKFEAIAGYAALSANKNGGTGAWMPGKGVRIFPDALNNTDTQSRNHLYVKAGLAGATGNVTLKIIDVDDPSPSATDLDPDYNHLVDPNDSTGEQGNDNTGDIGGGRSAVFVSNGATELTCTLGSDGIARINGQLPQLKVSMRPGDNYRVAVVQLPSDLGVLQVTNASASGYVKPSAALPKQFKGLCSGLLTVWRKIHVEQDTMSAIPVTGTEVNFETGEIDSITHLADGTFKLNLNVDLPGGQNRFQSGILNVEGALFNVVSNNNNTFVGDDLIVDDDSSGTMAAWAASQTIGQSFLIEDDDDRNIPSFAILPIPNIEKFITPYVLDKFAPAFIEPNDTQPNLNNTLNFKLNLTPPYNLAPDLVDRSDFWAIRLVAAYQALITEDLDPNPGTVGVDDQYITGEYNGEEAFIFLETLRDEQRGFMQTPPTAIGNTRFMLARNANVAHEIGHAPNPENANDGHADHAELGLMAVGFLEGYSAPFKAHTILRFRKAQKWCD